MIRRLTLVTNPDACNLRCPLCFLNQRGFAYGKGEMPWNVAKSAIDKYAGALKEIIPSTMGEPLLYSKFSELLDYSFALGIPLNLTTNGSFPGVWGTCEGLSKLVCACSDIKVSCMGFSEDVVREMMPGLTFEKWKANVVRLLEVVNGLKNGVGNTEKKSATTVSLQVTLHRKLLPQACEILAWAESAGIARIKWNLPVFLECAESLRTYYSVDDVTLAELRSVLRSKKIRSEGSLFFNRQSMMFGINERAGSNDENGRTGCNDENGRTGCVFFKDEIWVMPDGSEQHCPNPERRFGNPGAPGANCESCIMFY